MRHQGSKLLPLECQISVGFHSRKLQQTSWPPDKTETLCFDLVRSCSAGFWTHERHQTLMSCTSTLWLWMHPDDIWSQIQLFGLRESSPEEPFGTNCERRNFNKQSCRWWSSQSIENNEKQRDMGDLFCFVSPVILSCSDSCLILAEILRNNFRFGQSFVCVCVSRGKALLK